MNLARASDRTLNWEGCFNVRDLGGLESADGRKIRWGALVRSDLPVRLTKRGRTALLDHGIKSIVDLRFADEVKNDWERYPFRTDGGGNGSQPAYLNVPFFDFGESGPDEERIAAYQAAASRAELIQLDLDLNRQGIAAAVAAIADAPAGGVLVHCHAGKDRTGVVVALVLDTLGVRDEDIADDYALTAENIEPLIVEWLESMSDDASERERLRVLAMPAREAMLDALAYLRARYESAASYLRDGGVTQVQLDALKERLLAPT